MRPRPSPRRARAGGSAGVTWPPPATGPSGGSCRTTTGAGPGCGGRCTAPTRWPSCCCSSPASARSLWLAKAATSTTQDTLRTPFALWPSGVDWTNLADAWTKVEISKYFGNTLWVALGSWAVQLFVATTGGFVLSVLRPRYAKVVTAAVLATLFIPGIVVLVPLFLTVLDLPLFGTSIVDTYWAVWLPAGANAFNVLLVKRFMDGLPRDVFEAAQVDGAGPFRQLFYVALPLSRPILGVVSILAMLNAWKDYLWPLVVLPNPEIQPLSVRLPIIRETVELDVFLAALLISMALPITLFLVFQRLFLRSVSIGGAVKG